MANETTTKTRRSKGDGTIFKNSKGRWIARYTVKGMPSKEFSGKTKAEAKAKLDEYKFLVQSGEVVNLKLTVEQFGKKYLHFKLEQVARGNYKQSSYDRIETAYENHICPYPVSKVLMCNLKATDIQRRIDEMQPDYSLSTIKKVYQFFSAMVKYGKSTKDFPPNYDPISNVALPAESAVGVPTKQIEIVPEEYLAKFKEIALSYQADGELSYRFGPLLIFILNTGLREGEAMAISKTAISQNANKQRSIHISETVSYVKNRDKRISNHYIQIITPPKYPRSVRDIPLNQEANMCLEIMINTYGKHNIREDLIVCTKNGNIPTKRNIQVTFDRILKKCNMPHYGVHALRHTFATRLLKKTSSHQEIKAVAEMLGDDYKVVVSTYLHTEDSGKHDLVALL